MKNRNIWVSSDYHFGHPNITGPKVSRWKSGYRTFDTVHDMNVCLIETTNKYVGKDDILYFLGDFCFGGHFKTPTYRNFINSDTIHFMIGNHDKHIMKYADSFTSVNKSLIIEHNGDKIFLSHYSTDKSDCDIHLFGHHHDNLKNYSGVGMDVGVDVAYRLFGEYRPFRLEEAIELIKLSDNEINIRSNTI